MARILVVDDDEVSRHMMGRILQDAGHEIMYAGDGEAALERVRTNGVDIVVTDLAMPKLNGLRLIKALAEMHSEIPIIAISGENAEQLLLAADYGAEETLFKPISRKKLTVAVDNASCAGGGVWGGLTSWS